jgi:phosphoribosylanthranilate isomerase
MIKIKICGITNIEDAELALRLGADYLGFIFAPSPRQVSPQDAAVILDELSRKSLRNTFKAVGVFVNEQEETIKEVIWQTGIDEVQLHGEEDARAANSYTFTWYKALRVASREDVDNVDIRSWNCPRLLLDTRVDSMYGGTGQTVPLDVARYAGDRIKGAGKEFFLAGGITPDNVSRLIAALQPDGIDVGSGSEESKGKKSAEKMTRLFAETGH